MAGRHAGKAALPSAGFTRPPSLSVDGLRVTIYEEDGTVAGVCDFGASAGRRGVCGSEEMRKAFAAAFDRKSGPGGTWRSMDTCRRVRRSVVAFLKFASEQEEPAQATSDITPALWNAWCLSLPATAAGLLHRRTLRALLPVVSGIPEETIRVCDRRITDLRRKTPASYSYAEYEQIRAAAAAIFKSALVRNPTNRAVLRSWYAGQVPRDSPDWMLGQALHCILTTGDAPVRKHRKRHLRRTYIRVLGGAGPEVSWGRLFLTRSEAAAAGVLLVASESWNRSPLEKMLIPDHDPAAGEKDFDIHMVEVDKRRRPVRLRHTTNNLLDWGPDSPGRVMGQVIEATELARECLQLSGQPTRRLLVWRQASPRQKGMPFSLGVPKQRLLKPELGEFHPHNVSLQRLRRTVQVLIRKESAQNSESTHEDVYALGDPQVLGEVQDTIAQGLNDAVDHARAIVKMRVLLGEDADELIELSDDPDLARAIAEGEHDTPTAACTCFTSGPFTDPGLPCTASFLLCLACPNAVATRRHLPRLAYLQRMLDDLRAVLDETVWEHDWREHYLRLVALRKAHVPDALWLQEAAKITVAERSLIDRMLKRKLEAA